MTYNVLLMGTLNPTHSLTLKYRLTYLIYLLFCSFTCLQLAVTPRYYRIPRYSFTVRTVAESRWFCPALRPSACLVSGSGPGEARPSVCPSVAAHVCVVGVLLDLSRVGLRPWRSESFESCSFSVCVCVCVWVGAWSAGVSLRKIWRLLADALYVYHAT